MAPFPRRSTPAPRHRRHDPSTSSSPGVAIRVITARSAIPHGWGKDGRQVFHSRIGRPGWGCPQVWKNMANLKPCADNCGHEGKS
ncbi:hypothetical protein HMPREF9607_01749 [Cutibacterium modestum HL044PA1]|uniref:Uncharacterized protein n=1 Tax=Cutibacterium modestum HL044PA1 TaxID=765109 RepID=A0ABN0C4P4_9ACTN|nr:hypothetical protein HMPREF9607_01749 [Cutibacterium modestum HL044PA1]